MSSSGWSKANDGMWRARTYRYTPKQLVLSREYIGVIRGEEGEIVYAIDLEGVAIADTETRVLKMTQEQYDSRPLDDCPRWEVEDNSRNDIVSIVMREGYLDLTELNFEEDSRGTWEVARRDELPEGFAMTMLGCDQDQE